MEVVFRSDVGPAEGLKLLTRPQLDFLCEKAKCTIVHHISNQHIDAYILSESSLFVYKHRFIMKTCGTTTLLRCVASLLEFTDALGMELSYLGYSRKNLMYPSAQSWPHSSFGDEIRYLNTHEKLQNRLRGNGHILGPITGDHWFVYVADHAPCVSVSTIPPAFESISKTKTTSSRGSPETTTVEPVTSSLAPESNGHTSGKSSPVSVITPRGGMVGNSSSSSANNAANTTTTGFMKSISSYNDLSSCTVSNERTINLMMFDMAPEVAKIFYQSENGYTGREMTMKAGIHYLCPGATIDEIAFSPCGYSMNSILHDAYATIHITPEPQCSYASFETNTLLDNYNPMVRNVLNVFKPKRFVLTMFGDNSSMKQLRTLPTDILQYKIPGWGIYQRSSVSSTQADLELGCLMAVFSLVREEVATPTTTTTAGRQAQRSPSVHSNSSHEDDCSSSSCGLPDDPFGSFNPVGGGNLRRKKERSDTWC